MRSCLLVFNPLTLGLETSEVSDVSTQYFPLSLHFTEHKIWQHFSYIALPYSKGFLVLSVVVSQLRLRKGLRQRFTLQQVSVQDVMMRRSIKI